MGAFATETMNNKTSRRRRQRLSWTPVVLVSELGGSSSSSSRGTFQGCRVRVQVHHAGYLVGTNEVAGADRRTRSRRGTVVCSAGLQLTTCLAGTVAQ